MTNPPTLTQQVLAEVRASQRRIEERQTRIEEKFDIVLLAAKLAAPDYVPIDELDEAAAA